MISRVKRTGVLIGGVVRMGANGVRGVGKKVNHVLIKEYRKTRPIIIAHRGAPNYFMENTIDAYEKAIQLGADMLEIDIHLTGDNKLIVIHDNDIRDLTGIRGSIKNMSWKKIQKIRLADGSSIPSLDEVITRFKNKTTFLLEMKAMHCVHYLVKTIEKHKLFDKCIVGSFAHPLVNMVKKTNPKIKTVLHCISIPMEPEQLVIAANSDGIINLSDTLIRRTVNRCHKHKQLVFTLPIGIEDVEDKRSIRRLINTGVDGICTNNIEMVKEVYRKMKINKKPIRFTIDSR